MFDYKKYMKKYRKEHKEYYKIWEENHKQELKEQRVLKTNIKKEYDRQYYLNHKKETYENIKKYRQNPLHRLIHDYRKRIHIALKNNYKSSHTLELLGCSIEFLKKHLENQFVENMSWSNYGSGWYGKGKEQWHVDHIKSCYTFDLSLPDEQKKCFHYTNLRPLWAVDNLRRPKREILFS
jgi:hypothetical protein